MVFSGATERARGHEGLIGQSRSSRYEIFWKELLLREFSSQEIFQLNITNCLQVKLEYLFCQGSQNAGPPEQGRAEGESGAPPPPPQSCLLMCPFLMMSYLNVLFLKIVTKNVHENQQAKSRAIKIKLNSLKISSSKLDKLNLVELANQLCIEK